MSQVDTLIRRSQRIQSVNSVARRCSVWFGLPLIGNMMVLTTILMLGQEPIGIEWHVALAAVAPFILPAYAPALLFFTAILAVFDGRVTTTPKNGDQLQTNRMIASAVRLVLAIVLSFAAMVILIEPTMLIHVLFAALISFVAIMRAEVSAPTQLPTPEEKYYRALTWKQNAETWASQSLGIAWRKTSVQRLWPTVVMLILLSVIVPALILVIGGFMVWGPDVALAPGYVLLSTASMIGPVTLILAWLSSADKAESPRGRAWRRAYLLIMSAIAISMISFIFFFSGKNTAWMGWIVLGTSVLVSAVLLIRRPRWVAEARENIERRWTVAHLQRIQNEFIRAEKAWEREQVRPPVVVRSLATIIGLFREASRVAGEHRDFRA